MRQPVLAVIGAGVAGCTLAWRLAHAGSSVLLLDPAPGSGGSGNAWALLQHTDKAGLEAQLLREAAQLAQPALTRLLAADTLLTHGGQVLALAPHALLHALLADAPQLQHCALVVSGIQPQADGWTLQLADGSELEVAQVVLANAMAAAALWPALAPLLQPVRGQVDAFAAAAPWAPQLRRGAGGYAIASSPGCWLSGASFQPGRSDSTLDPADTQANRQRLAGLLEVPEPELQHCGGRASVRAVTVDRRPLVGAAPAPHGWARNGWPLLQAGLWVNAGHGAHGFATAFLAAEMLLAQLLQRPSAIEQRWRQALHPGRRLRR